MAYKEAYEANTAAPECFPGALKTPIHLLVDQAFISAALKKSVQQYVGRDAEQLHPWTANWTSPFEANEHLAGLLHPKGTQHRSPKHIKRLVLFVY